MKPIDKLLFGLLFGFSFPLFFFLVAVLGFYLFQDYNVWYFVITGLIIGILTDILLLRKMLRIALELPIWILLGLYLFYNICIYGMFMGFPVFNLGMGIIAGYYYGIKMNHKNFSMTQIEYIKKNVSLFTGFIMLLICISSALIALTEKTIGSELQGMLGLGFEVTRGMIIATIIIGGSTLIISQYFLTKIVLTITIKNSR
jgi:hypothetical protein